MCNIPAICFILSLCLLYLGDLFIPFSTSVITGLMLVSEKVAEKWKPVANTTFKSAFLAYNAQFDNLNFMMLHVSLSILNLSKYNMPCTKLCVYIIEKSQVIYPSYSLF